jgi:hypothetical protein
MNLWRSFSKVRTQGRLVELLAQKGQLDIANGSGVDGLRMRLKEILEDLDLAIDAVAEIGQELERLEGLDRQAEPSDECGGSQAADKQAGPGRETVSRADGGLGAGERARTPSSPATRVPGLIDDSNAPMPEEMPAIPDVRL